MSANLTPSKGEDQDFRKAATSGDLPAMEALLRLGANVNSENNYGQRALHNASSSGQTEAVEFLIRNGAQIHAKTKAGDTALLVAARNGHPQVVDMLLKEGAVPNACNADGWTALHFAVDRSHEAVVQTLLQASADPTIRTKDGKTPMDLMRDSAPLSLKNMLHEATVQQEMRSPLKRTSAPATPSMSRIASPPRVMSPEMAPRSVRANRSLMSEFNAAATTEEAPMMSVAPVAYQPLYAPVPLRHELLGSSVESAVRTGVVEKLIELVERQSAEIDVLRQEVNRLNLRVAELARVGFPHVLELRLDGRAASYHLGPAPTPAAAPAPPSAVPTPHPVGVAHGSGGGGVAIGASPLASSSAAAYQTSAHNPLTQALPAAASPQQQSVAKAAPRRVPFDETPIRPAKDALNPPASDKEEKK